MKLTTQHVGGTCPLAPAEGHTAVVDAGRRSATPTMVTPAACVRYWNVCAPTSRAGALCADAASLGAATGGQTRRGTAPRGRSHLPGLAVVYVWVGMWLRVRPTQCLSDIVGQAWSWW
jgi:hypothetical protein